MSRLLRFAILAIVAVALVTPAHANAVKKICLYNASGFAGSLQTLLGPGYNVVNIDANTWSQMTLLDFQACAAIYVPDTDNIQPSFSKGGYTAINNSKNTWFGAATGNIVASGVHLGGHGLQGGVGRVVKGFVDFATSTTGTGIVSGTDRGYNTYEHLTLFGVVGDTSHPCDDDIRIMGSAAGGPLASYLQALVTTFGVQQNDLANMGCSGHNFFPGRAGLWDDFAFDFDQSPAKAIVITRQAGSASSGGGFTVIATRNGIQANGPTGPFSISFTKKQGQFFGFGRSGSTLAMLLCPLSGGKGFVIVKVGRVTLIVACPPVSP